jgi:acetylornithine deacetylase/succinyl-diaminopimelate desuccinylase-like protein
MQSSISFRLVLVMLAMCVATVPACVPERADGEESSVAGSQSRQFLQPHQQLAQQIYQELVEINTVTDTGDTARAADAMAARLLTAGFSRQDVRVFKPAPRKGNLVARLRGTGERRPMLLMAHLDVVEAKRADWSTDPFKLVEKDGFFYARGAADDKFMAASFVAALIRFKQEGYRPARDLILVLETDEETFDRQGHGVQWLLQNQRALLDAEFALNEGGTVGALGGKPVLIGVQTSEKLPANFVLEVRNRGGHSSQPRKDNAIYQLARGLDKLAQFEFPIGLNETTRATLQLGAALQPPQVAAAMRALVAGSADPAALALLSADAAINATLRTTCVATLLEGGTVFNALPQSARATVNCRILPTETAEQTLATLQRVVADEQVAIRPEWVIVRSDPSPLNTEIMDAVAQVSSKFWPQAPVIPLMSPSATDGSYLRNAGIPTYGFTGLLTDLTDAREHGRDERVSVKAFHEGHESLYQVVKLLSAAAPAQR